MFPCRPGGFHLLVLLTRGRDLCLIFRLSSDKTHDEAGGRGLEVTPRGSGYRLAEMPGVEGEVAWPPQHSAEIDASGSVETASQEPFQLLGPPLQRRRSFLSVTLAIGDRFRPFVALDRLRSGIGGFLCPLRFPQLLLVPACEITGT